jgi:hypothetical protein
MFTEYVLYKKHDNIFYSYIKRDWNLFHVFELFETGSKSNAINAINAINATHVYAAIIYDVIKSK